MEIIKVGYTRVSEILKPLTDFKGIDKEVLENARTRGEILHEAIHHHWRGEFYPVGQYAPYFRSFLKWIVLTQFEPILAEFRLYDDALKITGRLDAFLKKGDRRVIVDWKAVSAFNQKYCELQGNFYHYLAKVNAFKPSDEFLFVRLDPDGALPKVLRFKPSELAWNQCLKLREQYFSSDHS